MNEFVILLIVVLLFLGMYIYANIFVFFEERKEKKRKKEVLYNNELKAQEKELKAQEYIRKQQIRDDKYKKLNARSLQIKEELKWLKQMNSNRFYTKNSEGTH